MSLVWVGVGTAVLSAGTSIYNSSQANKAAENAAKLGQVDINGVNTLAQNQAYQNAYNSAALERQLTPEVPQLRTAANQAVLNGLSGDAATNRAQALISSQLGQNLNTPLMQATINKAQSDLALGGSLPQDVQNLTTRTALAKSGAATGGLNLGRDLTARDLGLTSLQLENQRLQNASNIGGQEVSLATNNATNLLNQASLLNQIGTANRAYALNAGSYGQSIAPPVVGLDPTAIANLATGNASNASAAAANQANIYGQQANSYGQLAGTAGLLAYQQYNKPATTTTQPTTGAYSSLF